MKLRHSISSAWLAGGVLALLTAGAAAAGTVTGVVRNGTTGAAAPGVDVILIQLQGGMQTVANTKSDAQGRFQFDYPALGQQPMLLRAVYRSVNYHQPIPPGKDTADIEIFEPTTDPSALQVATRALVLQPNGAVLLVGEEYTIQNQSKPAKAFYKESGSFDFALPPGAELSQVAAWGPSAMPVVQGTIGKGPDRYSIAFPFRPGQSGVRLSYQLPYPNNQATLHVFGLYAVGRLLVVAPPSMQIRGDGFAPAGTEQGWSLYARDGVATGTTAAVSVSGTAPPPSDNPSQGAAGNAGAGNAAAEQSGPEAGGGGSTATAVLPARLDSVKWVLVAGFASLFALGILFLLRRPRQQEVSRAAAEVDRAVRDSVEDIKEALFRLELRRQAGTLSEEEYARQRSRTEKALRQLVKG